MRRLRQLMMVFVLVLTALAMPSLVGAQGGTLDQSNDAPAFGWTGTNAQQGQTFIAGRTGLLDQVELNGFSHIADQVTIQITAVDQNGQPTGPALGSGSFNAGDLPPPVPFSFEGGWVSVSITPPVEVVRGTQYAIVKPQSAGDFLFVWTWTRSDRYPQGTATGEYFGVGIDYRFRTYVLPTIPACNGLEATIYVKDGVIMGGPNNGAAYTGTLTGTSGSDVMVGTEAADAIDGRAGNDTICGLGGNDTIEGAAGNDMIIGGLGADKLNGASGTDTTPDYNASEGDKRTNVP